MLIQLQQIADEPFHWEESPSISAESLGRSELLGLGGISWSGRVVRDLAGLRLQAKWRTGTTGLLENAFDGTHRGEWDIFQHRQFVLNGRGAG